MSSLNPILVLGRKTNREIPYICRLYLEKLTYHLVLALSIYQSPPADIG